VEFNAIQRIPKSEWVPIVQLGLGVPYGPAFDPVDQVATLWTNKTGLQGGWAVSAVGGFGCQKAARFYSWTLWITTLTLRVRHRPSGSAPIDPQGPRGESNGG